MCNQANVPSVTLQTAVLMQVKEFATNGQTFSVHDITVAIRNKCGSGDLEVPEVEISGASFRFDIPHAKVKGIFDELWRTGVFDPILTLNRQFNGKFFEYTPTLTQPTVSATPAPVTATATNASNVGQNWGATAPAAVATPTPAAPLSDSEVEARIQTYLDNCETKGFQPTLKQIQSAIKRDVSTGWTWEKIKDYVESQGYSVVADPAYASSSQVVW